MPNGTSQLIKEVKSLLEEDHALSTKSALRLSLGVQVELYEVVKEQANTIKANSDKLDLLERKNIILWIEKHPKLVIGLLTFIVILTTIVDTRVVLAKFLGVGL